jgi:NAD(P)-dependent dehydrogenase (short-subunit alcohol dehydrogenase family)
MHDPRGLVIAVTGGARGIGAAAAANLARKGAKIAIGDIDGDAASKTAADIPGAVGLHLDVSDPGSYRAFLDEVAARLGPIDVLVLNAGVMWVGPFDDEPTSATKRQLAVNVEGVIYGIRAAVPEMRRRGKGQVIVVASAASRLAPPGEATYAASKHAVLGYCTAVRAELRGSGVDVSVLMPAVVGTELAAGTSSGLLKPLTPEQVAAAIESLVRRPRPELYVPTAAGAVATFLALNPARPRVFFHRILMPNQVKSDQKARQNYEHRTMGSS